MMHFWGITDTGLVRKDNQDSYAVEKHGESGAVFAVVCDGMGGVKGGGLASRIAVTTYMEAMMKAYRPEMTPEQLEKISTDAVDLANKAVYTASLQNECEGMGTTLVSAVSYPGGAVISNVGDSRAYHITQEGITCVTRDHSLVEEMVERGELTKEQARSHPKRNVITRALGPEKHELSDSFVCPMKSGEFLLLCSDGLVDTVTDQEILFEVIHNRETETCPSRLLAVSKGRGAPDNVTAVLLQMM